MSVKWKMPFGSGEADGKEGIVIAVALSLGIVGFCGVVSWIVYTRYKHINPKTVLDAAAA